jgi:hypothetical protein
MHQLTSHCIKCVAYLLLDTELVGVTALLLAAVSSTGRKTSIALAADHLFAVVLGSKSLQGRFNDTTTETEDQVQGGLLLDVVVGQSAAILELLTSKDKTLLVRRNSYSIEKERDNSVSEPIFNIGAHEVPLLFFFLIVATMVELKNSMRKKN